MEIHKLTLVHTDTLKQVLDKDIQASIGEVTQAHLHSERHEEVQTYMYQVDVTKKISKIQFEHCHKFLMFKSCEFCGATNETKIGESISCVLTQ